MAHSSSRTDDKTRALARYAAELQFQDLPPKVVDSIKASVLDTLGSGLFGSTTEWGSIISTFAGRQHGPAQLWGRRDGATSSSQYAAMANATMAHGFELDDLHPGSRSHPGALMTPIPLALRPQLGKISGRDMIVALAAGYELLGRVGIAQGISSFKRGWHPTGTAGSFGAAAATARLLGLSVEQTQHALGIAGAMPAGLMAAQFGAMVKRLYVGHATWAGMVGADLAASGFTGVLDIFDAEYGGYLEAVSDEINPEALTADLGTRFEAGNIGVKFWPCVGTNQPLLDAVADIVKREKFGAGDVDRFEVRTTVYNKLHSGWPYVPGTIMGAQMSMHYCIATMILKRRLTVDEFREDLLAAPATLDLVNRITVTEDETLDKTPGFERYSEVKVRLRDGRVLEEGRQFAVGSAKLPASWDQISDKFRGLALRVLPPSHVESIVALVSKLESVPDIAAIAENMSSASR